LGLFGILLGGLLLTVGFGTGCDESDGNATDATVAPFVAQEGVDDAGFGPPSLDELTARLDLTDEQARVVGEALREWQAAHEAMREQRRGEGRRGEGGPGFGGPRGDCPGPGEGRGGRFGHGPGGGPFMEFLAACSPVLETEQFVELTDFFAERREEHRGQVGNRRGPRGGGLLGMGLHGALREVNPTPEQRDAIREAVGESAEAVRGLMDRYRDDQISLEALRDGVGEARRELLSSLESILDAEQFTKLETVIAEMRAAMAERRLERIGEGIEHRVEVLTRMLSLTDEQALQIQATLESFLPRREELIRGVGDGSLEIENALYEGIKLRLEIHDAIRALLTPDQQERFDALRNLGGRRGGTGLGF
jgi:Spy/CpxP family protein refolding chaperone